MRVQIVEKANSNISASFLGSSIANAIVETWGVVDLLESRREVEAYGKLDKLVDALRIFSSVFADERSTREMGSLLERLPYYKRNCRWVDICDTLEYEVIPLLESWQN